MKGKVFHPFFYYLLFIEATVVMPIIINGIRVLKLWYYPFTTSGQLVFLKPFLIFLIVVALISVLLGYLFYNRHSHRFILVYGPMRLRNVIKAMVKNSLGIKLIVIYSGLYFVSYLITSGLLLIPGINVDSYFISLIITEYEDSGLQVIQLGNLYFIIYVPQLMLGIAIDAILTSSMMLSYYITSLIYVSLNIYSFPVPKRFRIYSLNTVGGFLSASVPSIGTIAGICCLTPTAINSLLYLASATLPFAKGITWKSGIFIGGTWVGGILQLLTLASPVILGIVLIGISTYYVRSISNRINEALMNRVRV